MPVHDVEKSLNDAEISKTLKVIILFRDPRGMLQSIYKIRTETTEWNLGKEQQERNDPARLCEKMKLDAEKAFALRNKYPGMDLLIAYVCVLYIVPNYLLRTRIRNAPILLIGKIYLVRYEDLCIHPHATITRLLNFLDLSGNTFIEKFIDQHTTVEQRNGNPYSTRRDSKYTAFKWTKLLKARDISKIQKVS